MGDQPFTLQPRSAQRRGPQSITDFVQRINAQPGGFRALSSADIQRRIDTGRDDGPDTDVDMTGDADARDDDAESDASPDDANDVAAAREELLRAIHQTSQTSMFALDFVSLLLSKETPATAVTTFSPGLRDMVGIGTLGATMLDAPTTLAQSRVPDNKMVAIGKRLMDLNKAADTALAASKRLQREIGSETRYWSEVLGVSEAGWQTFRLPHEPHTLAVQFGFPNTAPELKDSGVGPMRRAKDGSVRLEHGRMGGGSERLQVRILENGVVVGRSSPPRRLPLDARLEDRVKESRDTAFAQELFHEISREGRNKLDRFIRMGDSAAAYALDATTTISIRLVGPSEEEAAIPPTPQDTVANELCTILCLLLSNAHRANDLRRSEPAAAKGQTPTYFILTPLVSYYKYDRAVQRCAQSLASLVATLRSAGLSASVTMKEPALTPPPPPMPASTALATLLLRPPMAQFDLSITRSARMRILLRSAPLAGAIFSVSLLPAQQPQQQQQQKPPAPAATNPLVILDLPASEEYTDLDSLLAYVHGTVPRVIASAFSELVAGPKAPVVPSTDNSEGRGSMWTMVADNTGIVDWETGGDYGVQFGLQTDAETGQARLTAEGAFGGEAGKTVQRVWTWPGAGETLGAVVERVLRSGPRE
ncbi:subunit 17 of mediator complex-domain-containing protein [Staphylotrichum tortipilum]|uniref:Mediator of RNA polymerase II transcription subunit 17 n=1 Tax=Staphylotrichum tortipilum TaxID=2831512 RepID=A0AAN6RSZ5_9PEZI|nr:subunit 17 of mediator complex-domain-containing protein [Staphylotrichum longicolle]